VLLNISVAVWTRGYWKKFGNLWNLKPWKILGLEVPWNLKRENPDKVHNREINVPQKFPGIRYGNSSINNYNNYICDQILENLPFGHKQIFWENSNKKVLKIFFKLIFIHLNNLTNVVSCYEISQPEIWIIISDQSMCQKGRFPKIRSHFML